MKLKDLLKVIKNLSLDSDVACLLEGASTDSRVKLITVMVLNLLQDVEPIIMFVHE